MKNKRILKSFTALSFDGNGLTGAEAPAPSASELPLTAEAGLPDATTKLDDLREMLRQRYTAPYAFSAPYRYWGINE